MSDINKLNDVSKDVLLRIPASELAKFMTEWVREYKPKALKYFEGNEEYIAKILDLGRTGNKPRKDLVYAKQIFDFISYFFDDYFVITDQIPEQISDADATEILKRYLESYDQSDDQSQWFDKIRSIAEDMGYAAKPKDYKKHPEEYKVDVGYVSTVLPSGSCRAQPVSGYLGDPADPGRREDEEQMKSERFRNELITNVSHDIKTPLTSIINYVDFLKKEDIDNEKAQEYIGVLDRQANRLKKLTEDLVEASKAATGSIKLEKIPCRVGVLMMQVMGEYQEKTEAADLTMIPTQPEEDLEILADGRSLWRVFDNLLNNICKYSQPGTRVYQTLERQDDKAVIIYRNTSAYELNITEEELMERFVRGDKSRHTEGSGLGFSIARNLVELQGGSFHIHIDGDLFKVVIEFPLYHGMPYAVTIPEK